MTKGIIAETLLFRYKVPIEAVDTHRPKPKGAAPAFVPSTARQYFAADVEAAARAKAGLAR